MCLNGFAAIWWRIMCYNEPDWNETMDLQSRLTGQCVTARHRSAEHENRTTKAEMSVNNEHECNKKSNQWELISLTCSCRVRCACVNMSVKKKIARVCLFHALLVLLALGSICHVEVRCTQSGQTALHYWVWFRVLGGRKNIVVEINFQHGTQTLRSTELEVISCWLHKTHSIDRRPCGSRQIAWLIAMCWKRMPALCILAKMDVQTANSGLFWAWLSCWQQTVDQLSMLPELDLTLPCLFSSLQDVNGASTSHLPVHEVASVWPLWEYLATRRVRCYRSKWIRSLEITNQDVSLYILHFFLKTGNFYPQLACLENLKES